MHLTKLGFVLSQVRTTSITCTTIARTLHSSMRSSIHWRPGKGIGPSGLRLARALTMALISGCDNIGVVSEELRFAFRTATQSACRCHRCTRCTRSCCRHRQVALGGMHHYAVRTARDYVINF